MFSEKNTRNTEGTFMKRILAAFPEGVRLIQIWLYLEIL